MADNDMKKIDREFANIRNNIYPNLDTSVIKLDNDKRLEDIRNSLSTVKTVLTGRENSNILELSFSLYNDIGNEKGKAGKKRLLNLSKVIENNQMASISNLLYAERERILLYENYKIINDMIPQLPEAIQTFVDNIISPDDFSKQSLNIVYDYEGNSNNENYENFITILKERFNKLKSLYGIENKVIKYIKESLKFGDQFVAVLKLSQQIKSHLLNEDEDVKVDNNEKDSYILEESNLDLKKEELAELSEIFKEEIEKSISESHNKADKEYLEKIKDKVNDKYIKSELIKLLNENFEISDNPQSILSEANTLKEEYSSDPRLKEYYKKAEENLTSDLKKHTSKKKNDEKDELDVINGSVIKVLDSSRTIKLWADGFCYGYYYIDVASKDSLAEYGINIRNKDSLNLFANPNLNQDRLLRTKEDFIYSLIIRNIAKKLNKESILNNLEFKSVIYNVLRQNFIFNKKIQLVYFDKDEVIHFKPNDDEDEYGVSLYRDILFTAKIYIAVLTSTLMIKIVRSADKRIWYVDIGLGKDREEVINQTINDVKGKDIRMNDFDDIGKVLSNMGVFTDLWIPTFSGEKPLEVENLEGQSADMENDFLNYLKKAIVTGMGVPSPYLGDTDEVELAKMLAMLNGKFVRRTVTYQKNYETPASLFVRKLYENEFGSEIIRDDNKLKKKNLDETEIPFDINKVCIKFPKPSSLMFSNTNDQISSSKDIIEFVSDTLLSADESNNENLVKEFKRNIAKELIPSIEWEKFELIKSRSLAIINKRELENDKEEEDDTSSDEEDMGSDFNENPDEDLENSGNEEEPNPDEEEETSEYDSSTDFSNSNVSIKNKKDIELAKKQLEKGSDEENELANIENMEKNLK
jgi:hypothetical protein